MAVKAGGDVWAWGENSRGELGFGDDTDKNSPVSTIGTYPSRSEATTPRSIVDIVAGDKLIWNGDIAGYNLDSDKRVDLNYYG
jgi:alpha-tubulin suppressor-like RCC1 family protein